MILQALSLKALNRKITRAITYNDDIGNNKSDDGNNDKNAERPSRIYSLF